MNECATSNGGCAAEATCTNLPGRRSCACQPGYRGNGETCEDVDECAENTLHCGPNAHCTNAPGTASCACDDGFTGDGQECHREWAQLAASGNGFSLCGIRADGSLWCWAVSLVQLGNPALPHELYVPTRVGTASDWRKVAVGDGWACALKTDRTLWCFGRNEDGELGNGNDNGTGSPVRGGSDSDWVDVAAGANHT